MRQIHDKHVGWLIELISLHTLIHWSHPSAPAVVQCCKTASEKLSHRLENNRARAWHVPCFK